MYTARFSTRAALSREQQMGGSGGSIEPPGPLLEPPEPLLTHLHTVYIACYECLPTHLNPLAERTCFSQALRDPIGMISVMLRVTWLIIQTATMWLTVFGKWPTMMTACRYAHPYTPTISSHHHNSIAIITARAHPANLANGYAPGFIRVLHPRACLRVPHRRSSPGRDCH